MTTDQMNFNTIEELRSAAKEWQNRLFLNDWVITVVWHTPEEYPGDEGHIEFDIMNQTATVSLLREMPQNRISKNCHELTLIHELLHLKLGFIEADENLEGTFWNMKEHQKVYQLSKSLFMAKYGLNTKWFKNSDTCI